MKVSCISLKFSVDKPIMLKKAPEASVQQGFHCSCFARNENLAIGRWFSCHLHLFTCSTLSSNCAANDFTLDFKSIFLPSSVLVKIKSQEPTSLSHWFLKYSAKFLLRPSISGTE